MISSLRMSTVLVTAYRAADKDSSLTGHLTVIIFDPGFIVHVCPDK